MFAGYVVLDELEEPLVFVGLLTQAQSSPGSFAEKLTPESHLSPD